MGKKKHSDQNHHLNIINKFITSNFAIKSKWENLCINIFQVWTDDFVGAGYDAGICKEKGT